jgi:hypothetical protein
VATDANIRSGPGTVYPVYGVMLVGEIANVLGKDQTGTWYVIVYPKSPNGQGWIWGNLVTLCGDHSNVPVVAAPPTPTYTPTATFTPTYTFTPTFTYTPSPTTAVTVTRTGTLPPPPTVGATPPIVTGGCDLTNVTISWNAPGASSATLNGAPVAVPKGSQGFCVLQDTDFTLVATYPGGAQQQATVTVDVQIIALH